MKKRATTAIYGLMLSSWMCGSSNCFAESANEKSFVLTVVDSSRLSRELKEARSISSAFQEERQALEQNQKALIQEIQRLDDRIKRDADVLKPAELEKMKARFQGLLERYQQEFNSEHAQMQLAKMFSEMQAKVQECVRNTVQSYAEASEYDVIFEKALIAYARSNVTIDVTEAVLKQANKTSVDEKPSKKKR